jgi:hypothetical protein
MIDAKDISLSIKSSGSIDGLVYKLTLVMTHVPSGKTVTVKDVELKDEVEVRKEMLETLDVIVNKTEI